MKAIQLDYTEEMSTISTRFDDNKGIPLRAIYVPERGMLVTRDPDYPLQTGTPGQVYRTIVGPDDARTEYERILGVPGIEEQEIDVDDAFVTWAGALYRAKNPPKEIVELLEPKLSSQHSV